MRSIEINGIKIYELTKDIIIPDFLASKRKQKVKKQNKEITSRLEVIQDLTMPDVSNNVSLSPDGNYLFVLGAYSPRIKCFDLEQMSMKFERNVDEMPTKMAFIERDYSKFVVLEGQKCLAIHGPGGLHKKVRMDHIVTDIIYSNYTDKLYVPSASGEISMIDIDTGTTYNKFIDKCSYKTNAGINCASYESSVDIFMCGTRSGVVNGYDPRNGEHISRIDVTLNENPEDMRQSYKPEISKIAFKNLMEIGVGTDKGVVHLYDLRNTRKPWSSRDLDYRCPLVNIIFHEDNVIGALGSIIKIWEPRAGNDEGPLVAYYDTNKKLNDFFHYPGSGLFIGATDEPQLPVLFIPRLGKAPRWCEKLNNLVVNLAVETQSLYDTHKFVTLDELDRLNLKHLIGTPSLHAHTHGYYISNKTYQLATNAMALLLAKEDGHEVATMNTQSLSIVDDDDLIPDPIMNVPIKALSVQPRFSAFFKNEEFIVDPTNKEFTRVIDERKHLEKKRKLKMARKSLAVRAHKLAKNEGEGEDDGEVVMESDSESD